MCNGSIEGVAVSGSSRIEVGEPPRRSQPESQSERKDGGAGTGFDSVQERRKACEPRNQPNWLAPSLMRSATERSVVALHGISSFRNYRRFKDLDASPRATHRKATRSAVFCQVGTPDRSTSDNSKCQRQTIGPGQVSTENDDIHAISMA